MSRTFSLTRADFAKIRAFKRILGEYFSLAHGTLPGRPSPGAAIVVSSKVASRAVERNTIKRRSRALLSQYMKNRPVATVILYAKKGAAKASFGDLKKDIESLLSKI